MEFFQNDYRPFKVRRGDGSLYCHYGTECVFCQERCGVVVI